MAGGVQSSRAARGCIREDYVDPSLGAALQVPMQRGVSECPHQDASPTRKHWCVRGCRCPQSVSGDGI